MARPKKKLRATKARERVSPLHAVEILMTQTTAPAAAKRITGALHERPPECRIWRDGKLVRPAEVEHLSVLEGRDDAGRRYATIGDDRWDAVPAEYEFDADEVRGLLSPPTSTPRRAVKPGPEPKHDWPIHVTREVIRRLIAGEKFPSAAAMLQWCGDKWDWQPDIRQIQRHLKDLRG
jgi:hypothetical protein